MVFLVCLVINFVGICLVRHPILGFSDSILTDGEAVATGHLQYGNPATQFVGFPYTPLFVWTIAGLLKIYWWGGWGPIVSMLAAVAAITSLVRLLWLSSRDREYRLVTASFVVALSLGGLAALPIVGFPISGLEEGRPDQLAWCLLVVAGTIVFRGLLSPQGLSVRQMLIAGLLLTTSWAPSKQHLCPASSSLSSLSAFRM